MLFGEGQKNLPGPGVLKGCDVKKFILLISKNLKV